MTGYCIRCEAMQTTFENMEKKCIALKARIEKLRVAVDDKIRLMMLGRCITVVDSYRSQIAQVFEALAADQEGK